MTQHKESDGVILVNALDLEIEMWEAAVIRAFLANDHEMVQKLSAALLDAQKQKWGETQTPRQVH